MKFEPSHCPACNEPTRYTCDTIPGYAKLTEPDANGITEYTGETDVDWDGQQSNQDEEGRIEVACRNWHRWAARDSTTACTVPTNSSEKTHMTAALVSTQDEEQQYLVTWEIDIVAATPAEAARKALAIQRDPDSIATVFDVADKEGSVTRVDLSDEDGLAQEGE